MTKTMLIIMIVCGLAGVSFAQVSAQTDAAATQAGVTDPAAEQREPGAAADQSPDARLATLRRQLEQWVTQTGVPSNDEREAVAQRLDALAEQSAKLAEELPEAQQKLQARYLELTVRNAQLQQAQVAGDDREQSYRVGQLRAAAFKVKSVDAGAADALGDFWLLQADLYDLNRATQDVSERQRRAIELMERFVRPTLLAGPTNRREAIGRQSATTGNRPTSETQSQPAANVQSQGASAQAAEGANGAPDDSARDDAQARRTIIRDVKLALLRLYDQQGRSTDAARLVAELRREAPDDEALQDYLNQWFGYVSTIGQRFDASLNLANDDANATPIVWSGRAQRGKVVLLCFWADWYRPSVDATDKLKPAVARFADQGFEVLTVQLPATPPLSSLGVTQAGGANSPADATVPQIVAAPDQRKADEDNRPEAKVAWSNYREGPGQVSLRRMFTVRSLPRYVLIARDGRVVAIGGSTAILDQIPGLLAEPAPSPYRR